MVHLQLDHLEAVVDLVVEEQIPGAHLFREVVVPELLDKVIMVVVELTVLVVPAEAEVVLGL